MLESSQPVGARELLGGVGKPPSLPPPGSRHVGLGSRNPKEIVFADMRLSCSPNGAMSYGFHFSTALH